MCRLCGEREETVSHIVAECKKLAQKEYKMWRHDKVGQVIHWKLCQKFKSAGKRTRENGKIPRIKKRDWENLELPKSNCRTNCHWCTRNVQQKIENIVEENWTRLHVITTKSLLVGNGKNLEKNTRHLRPKVVACCLVYKPR